MASAASFRRALSNASVSSSPRAASHAQGKRRLMGTASAASLPLEEQPAIEIQIFDIFDAPSRLGESSRLLQASSPPRTSSTRSDRTLGTSDRTGATRFVQSLPAPIMYDGPAQPGRRAVAYRGTRAISGSAAIEKPLLSSLPPPVVFDGPSRLRPYARTPADQSVRFLSRLTRCVPYRLHHAGIPLDPRTRCSCGCRCRLVWLQQGTRNVSGETSAFVSVIALYLRHS